MMLTFSRASGISILLLRFNVCSPKPAPRARVAVPGFVDDGGVAVVAGVGEFLTRYGSPPSLAETTGCAIGPDWPRGISGGAAPEEVDEAAPPPIKAESPGFADNMELEAIFTPD